MALKPRHHSDTLTDWTGPHTVVIPRAESGFGFTLRHFVVYPPQSVLETREDDVVSSKGPRVSRELSLEPQDTIFVKSVKEGTPAQYAGLNTGDRIIAVNGIPISGRSYKDVISAIHQSGVTLKLLVVPKDEDILQMAYQTQSGESMYSSSSSLSDFRSNHSEFSSKDVLPGTTRDYNQLTGSSRELNQFTGSSRELNQFAGSSGSDICYWETSGLRRDETMLQDRRTKDLKPQDKECPPAMTTNVTCNIHGKSKYSFGLYFPPKPVTAESCRDTKQPSSYRKTSLDESAKSRDFFIRYSSDKAASDQRNRYSPRHSAYEKYISEKPTYIISRSQTVSAISPYGQTDVTSESSKQYVPVLSDKKMYTRSSGSNQSPGFTHQSDSSSGSQTFVVRIPLDQHKAAENSYGTTFALTRSPNTTHIEIQKSISKPIVSQRKFQFETGKNENTPPLILQGQNRYKSEIEKIRTQPKFSSIAMRKASFEQSPDRDPPGCDDPVIEHQAPGPLVDTAQPTIKVRKIAPDVYTSHQVVSENIPIRIYMSPSVSSVDIYTVDSRPDLSQPTRTDHSPSPGPAVSDTSGMADSGVWVKSYHSSSDMLDGLDSLPDTAEDEHPHRTSRPARKSSYLSAVNAPHSLSTRSESPSVVEPPPQSSILHTSAAPRIYLQTKVLPDGQSSMGSTHSLSSLSSVGLPVASVAPTVVSTNEGVNNLNVSMRKKLPESNEDQANKLHRRTSYLMATARDRTNVVPIEKAFSPPQPITEDRSQPASGSFSHHNSIKLNKFFGENISVIAESAEQAEIPEVIRKGSLTCKISVIEGKKCSDRSWKTVFAILRQTELYLMKDKDNSLQTIHEDHHIALKSCRVESARDYAKKKKHVFRLSTYNECEYLFQTEDRGTMLCWIQAIKSINEPEKAEKMDEMIEKEKTLQTCHEATSSNKLSPQMGQKVKKLAALSFKSKLTSSPSMRRKKSSEKEKEKEENLKKGWKGRIPMMKSLKKHTEESNLSTLTEQEVDKMQFGVHLEDCFPSPHNEYVPLIVELCTRIVEARGLEVVGVYRVPGNSAAVNALTEEFNRGIDSVNIDNEKLLDINVISSLLKSFFRKLPEPLIPADMYDAFIEANRYPDEDKRKLKIKRLLHLLPQHNNETLKHMAEHLNKVASYGHINKMDAKNLAIMFGPTLIRKKGDDTVSLVTDMSDQCRIVESIILHHEWFFSTWDQDNYIPMETTVETVNVDDGQNLLKDDDEEADSAISAKQIISSIVGAASRKLKQQAKSNDSLDFVDTCSVTTSSNMDETFFSSRTKSLSSSRSASEEFLEHKPSIKYTDSRTKAPIANSEPDFLGFEYADTLSPTSSNFSRRFSDDSLTDKNDELEISHGLPSSLSREAIHKTLKRIGNDVSTLLQTFEEKQSKDRERRRLEQEMIEREHLRTQLELEQEEKHSVEDWLAWKGSRVPDLVSSSYLHDNRRSFHGKDTKPETKLISSHEDILPKPKVHNVNLRIPPRPVQKAVQERVSLRSSLTRRHGSLDSLIDQLEKQEQRTSWASTDSEDGSDLLTSITATFDQKLQILLNPKYKLTGRKTDPSNDFSSIKSRNSGTSVSFLDSADKSFRDPSLHRSAKSDPKIGIASRFERNESNRVVSPVLSEMSSNLPQQKKNPQLPEFRSFLTKSQPSESPKTVVLTQPKKLDTGLKNARTAHHKPDLAAHVKAGQPIHGTDKENRKSYRLRRHTVGGVEDFEHILALNRVSDHRLSAWEQLQPAVIAPQAWLRKERARGSTPDLTGSSSK